MAPIPLAKKPGLFSNWQAVWLFTSIAACLVNTCEWNSWLRWKIVAIHICHQINYQVDQSEVSRIKPVSLTWVGDPFLLGLKCFFFGKGKGT